MDWMTRESGFDSQQRQRFFSSPQCPDQLWDSFSLPSNGYLGLYPWGYNSQDMKMTTHLHLVLILRMCGAISSLLQMSSCHDI
jgi:hypothetical protein